MAVERNEVTLAVSDATDFRRRVSAAFAGREQGAVISFATPELLWRTLTVKRWEILKLMSGAGPLSIREVARRSGRDVKAVHRDVVALIEGGILDRTPDGVEFPYASIRVDFVLKAA